MFRKIGDYIVYLLYKFFQFMFLRLPYKTSLKILDFVSFLAFKFDNKHKKIALANLNLVYGDSMPYKKKDEIIRTSYKSLLYNIFEFIENQNIKKDIFFSKIEHIDDFYIQNMIDAKRNIIFITAHYGGWEIALPWVNMKFGINVGVVNRKMNNPYIQEEYKKGRAKNGINMIDKKIAGKGMIKSIKNGEAVAVVVDQHIGYGSVVEFLGQKAMATDSTSRLALKFDAVLIPVFAVCNGFRNYTIKTLKPIDIRDIEFKSDNRIDELTQIQNDIITNQILEYPDVWFWQHKRFKEFHSKIYED